MPLYSLTSLPNRLRAGAIFAFGWASLFFFVVMFNLYVVYRK